MFRIKPNFPSTFFNHPKIWKQNFQKIEDENNFLSIFNWNFLDLKLNQTFNITTENLNLSSHLFTQFSLSRSTMWIFPSQNIPSKRFETRSPSSSINFTLSNFTQIMNLQERDHRWSWNMIFFIVNYAAETPQKAVELFRRYLLNSMFSANTS